MYKRRGYRSCFANLVQAAYDGWSEEDGRVTVPSNCGMNQLEAFTIVGLDEIYIDLDV